MTTSEEDIIVRTMRPLVILVLVLAFVARFLAQQAPSPGIKVDVDLVLVNVTVTDSEGRYVVGLEKENFQVWEDKVGQDVQYFSTEDAPLSVGLIFDASGSMQSMLQYAQQAALSFLQTADAHDEYFLVVFNQRPHVAVDLTTDLAKLQTQIISIPAKGSTALYDAVYLGAEKLRKATYPKRALITITDGEENSSRYRFSNLRELVKEQNVQIFSIGALGPINELVKLTGGYAFHGDGLADICQKIAVELKNEYVIGYVSSNPSKNGNWRKILVKVTPPRGLGKLNVRAKGGYYGPTS